MSKIYNVRRAELEYGRKQLKELFEYYHKNKTSTKEIISDMCELFPFLDFSKFQPNSWKIRFGINRDTGTTYHNVTDLDRVIEVSEVPLKSQLQYWYEEQQLSSGDISRLFQEMYGITDNPNKILHWLDLCDIPRRNKKECIKLRWDKPEEREKASQKTTEYFKTPEGQKRRKEISEWYREVYLPNYVCNKTSKIEQKIKDFLEEINSGFVHQKRIFVAGLGKNGIVPDFMKGSKIIEVYGNYWHNRITALQYDKKRIGCLEKAGYSVLVLWETEIEGDWEYCKSRIKEFIAQE